jgi:hypothetical protein
MGSVTSAGPATRPVPSTEAPPLDRKRQRANIPNIVWQERGMLSVKLCRW